MMTPIEKALNRAEMAVFALRLAAEGKDVPENLTVALQQLAEAEIVTEAELKKAVDA